MISSEAPNCELQFPVFVLPPSQGYRYWQKNSADSKCVIALPIQMLSVERLRFTTPPKRRRQRHHHYHHYHHHHHHQQPKCAPYNADQNPYVQGFETTASTLDRARAALFGSLIVPAKAATATAITAEMITSARRDTLPHVQYYGDSPLHFVCDVCGCLLKRIDNIRRVVAPMWVITREDPTPKSSLFLSRLCDKCYAGPRDIGFAPPLSGGNTATTKSHDTTITTHRPNLIAFARWYRMAFSALVVLSRNLL